MATVKIKFRVSSIETKAGTLYYQVIHNRLVKQVHFGYKLYPSEWDADCSRVILSSGIEKGQEGYLLSMKTALANDLSRFKEVIVRLERSDMAYTADKVVELVKKDGKTYVVINDYEKVRELFGELLAEIQRIKSTGDYDAARELVESYAVKVDPELHAEVLERYKKLNLAPYKGFVNPKYEAVTDADGNITDVKVTYDEGYAEQMLRYSKDYSALPSVND